VFGSGKEQYWNTLYVHDTLSSHSAIQQGNVSLKVSPLDQKNEIISTSVNENDESYASKIPRAKLE